MEAYKGFIRPIIDEVSLYMAASGVTEYDYELIKEIAQDIALLAGSTSRAQQVRLGEGVASLGQQPSDPVSAPSLEDLPTLPDDPRLSGWYQTIELGRGLVSRGAYDHRSVVDCYGLPKSLHGKTCLDVGTANGFFAFEMERRGAARVVAIDILRYGDLDLLPQIKAKRQSLLDSAAGHDYFEIAHALRRSSVEFKPCNVYDLSPESVGVFDLVFCGSLLLHLQNPFKALINIRSVTRGMAIIETAVDTELDERFPDKPWLSFGCRESEAELGEACVYWRFSSRALEEMLAYAGFAETKRQKSFSLPPAGTQVTAVVAYPMLSGGRRPL
jgi:tRNA (mo5U34)-methyltransferase